jgi:3-phenylpropionate/trans-cinnamate dioxygenase ferredoxin component
MISDRESLEGFHRICSIKDLNENTGKRFIINNLEIAVFLIQNKAYAVSNICPHKHSALIYDGFVEDENVVCPAHGWTFNIKNGKTLTGSKGLDVYETVCVEDQVYVKVEEKKYSW